MTTPPRRYVPPPTRYGPKPATTAAQPARRAAPVPPPTRFGPAPGQIQAAGRRIPPAAGPAPPPTRFGPAPGQIQAADLRTPPAAGPAPPLTRFGSSPTPAIQRRAAPTMPPAPRPPSRTVQRMEVGEEEEGTYYSNFVLNPSFLSDLSTFHPDSSDSETEVEDESRTIDVERYDRKRKLKVKVSRPQKDMIFNKTKRSGRRKHKGRWMTRRDRSGHRLVPRINNHVYNTNVSLTLDAKAIHDVIPETIDGKSNQSFGATTILCCIMKRNGEYRRLCFVNTGDSIQSALVEKAESLNYHFIQAEKAHAEGELIEYLYTYHGVELVGMGCDKPHCQECAHLLGIYLQTDTLYTDTTVSDNVFDHYNMPEPLQNATGYEDRPSVKQEWKVNKRRRIDPEFMTEKKDGGEKEQ